MDMNEILIALNRSAEQLSRMLLSLLRSYPYAAAVTTIILLRTVVADDRP